jgi:hypothetical protein
MHPDYDEIKSLRARGWSFLKIGRHFGADPTGIRRAMLRGDASIPGTTRYGANQARAFYRFPINSHKPGPG